MRLFKWFQKPVMKQPTHIEHCLPGAKWSFGKVKKHLAGEGTKELIHIEAEECFWYIVLAHFKDISDVHRGYTINQTIPSVIRCVGDEFIAKVIVPRITDIAESSNEIEKSKMVEELSFVFMHGVFDMSGGPIHTEYFRDVFEAVYDSHTAHVVKATRDTWLPVAGFKAHHHSEGCTWYWPHLKQVA